MKAREFSRAVEISICICFIVLFSNESLSENSTDISLFNMYMDTLRDEMPNDRENFSTRFCVCGRQSTLLSPRIVGGGEVDIAGKYPWMVALVRKKGLMRYKLICGGALISKSYVLTAAHCVLNKNESKIRLIMGLRELPTFLPRTSISRYIIHPNFNSSTKYNDIALLKLKKPVKFNDFVSPICLPTRKDFVSPRNAITAGWGTIQDDAYNLSKTLREVVLPIMPNEYCDIMYYDYVVSNATICAGETGKDACQGDSGGPLFIEHEGKWYIIGIVSWGVGCAVDIFPGIYTRVSHYLDWIRNSTVDAPPCTL